LFCEAAEIIGTLRDKNIELVVTNGDLRVRGLEGLGRGSEGPEGGLRESGFCIFIL
jgi:hypothetical protein